MIKYMFSLQMNRCCFKKSTQNIAMQNSCACRGSYFTYIANFKKRSYISLHKLNNKSKKFREHGPLSKRM